MSSNALDELLWIGNAQRNRLIKFDSPLGKDWLVPLQARGTSRIGRDYEFIVDLASSRGEEIKLGALIGQGVTLWLQQTDGSYLPHHGYVHQFDRLGSDGPLSFYQLRFSSWMYLLRLRRDMRDWQEQSGEQILADVFEQHPQAQGAYRFELRTPMPKYSSRVQWEDDWNFVHRSLEDVGAFGRFEHAADGRSHTLVLSDDLFFVPPLDEQTVRFVREGLRGEVEGLTQWRLRQSIQSATLTSRTFDYKRPDLIKQTCGYALDQKQLPAHGEVYEYSGAYTWPLRAEGDRQSARRMEEWASQAQRFYGVGCIRSAMPGRWFSLAGHPVHDKELGSEREFAIVAVDWIIRNNLPGMEGVAHFADSLQTEVSRAMAADAGGMKIAHPDGSVGFFQTQIEVQRRRAPYRSPREHHKPVMQIHTAIVAGPDNEEIYTDALNRIKVWFPWNRRNRGDENASCWVRAAFPDAGTDRGGHFPLRKGDEVLIGFVGGDCDRPIVLARMHGGDTKPLWHTNGLLSGYRSKEYGGRGYNQLLMDDSTGQNRIHLYSTSANSHLHLGYQIDQNGNTRGAYLGSGFDLKSDASGSVRAGQGLYVSTHPTTAEQPLDVSAASGQLTDAQSVIEGLSESSVAHEAESLKTGADAMKAFADATQSPISGKASGGRTAGGGTGTANGFKKPLMWMTSAAGMGLSTQQTTHIAAEEHLNLVSGQSTHIASGKSLVASVAEKISLFARNAGMKLFAGKGKVLIQAHSDGIELTAQKLVKLVSAASNIDIASAKEVLLTSGGAYVRIADGNIEIHAPGTIDIKGGQRMFAGPASMDYPLPALPTSKHSAAMQYLYHDDEPVQGAKYTATLSDGSVREGTLDSFGRLRLDDIPPGPVKVELGPDARAYRRKDATPNPDFKGERLAESDIDSLLNKHGGA